MLKLKVRVDTPIFSRLPLGNTQCSFHILCSWECVLNSRKRYLETLGLHHEIFSATDPYSPIRIGLEKHKLTECIDVTL